MTNKFDVVRTADTESANPPTGGPKAPGEHSVEQGDRTSTAKPFTYTPTPSEFREAQKKLRALADEQDPNFHDGKIVPDLSKLVAKLNEEKVDNFQTAGEGGTVNIHRIQGRPYLQLTPAGPIMTPAPDRFDLQLVRPDGSLDRAMVDNQGKVMQEEVRNVSGSTMSYFRPDGTLANERHSRDGYSDSITYDDSGKLAVATHIRDGNTAIDDIKQPDASWIKTRTVRGDRGDILSTDNLVTKSDGSTDFEHREANGDYLKYSKDANGVEIAHDQENTVNGLTNKLYLENGEMKLVVLKNI